MWIPHFTLAPLKPNSPAPTIQASRDDRRPREFIVALYLSNPLTKARDIDIQHRAEKSYSMPAESGETVSITLAGGQSGRLGELICRTQAEGVGEAVRRCHDAASRLLDHWSVRHGRGMTIAGLRAADAAHDAKWRAVPFRPSTLDPGDDGFPDMPADLRTLAFLYREGRNAASPAYRLLCATRILHWHKAGERPERRTPTVTREMLVLSGAWDRLSALEGREYGELLAHLAPARERVIGMLTGDDAEQEPGAFDWMCDLSILADLADFAARQVLLDAFGLQGGAMNAAIRQVEEVV